MKNTRENRAYRLAMSVGIAVTDCDKLCSIDDLLSRADARMYEEKKKKSNAKSSIRSGCVADEAIAGIDGLSENTP